MQALSKISAHVSLYNHVTCVFKLPHNVIIMVYIMLYDNLSVTRLDILHFYFPYKVE